MRALEVWLYDELVGTIAASNLVNPAYFDVLMRR